MFYTSSAQTIPNKQSIAYDSFGSPEDTPVVLIHGLGTQRIGWPDSFCKQIADQGFRVIRFDNRDIGQSSKREDLGRANVFWAMAKYSLRLPVKAPYSLEDMVDDTRRLLDNLAIDQAHIVGLSMGGMIAQLFAYHLPVRTLSLTSIMSTSGKRGLPGPSPAVKNHLFSSPPTNGKDAIIEHEKKFWRLISSQTHRPDEKELDTFLTESFERDYPNRGGTERQLAAVIANGSRVKALKNIQAPSLVIHGKQDPFIPFQAGIDTAKHIPGSKLELIEHMGHDLPPPILPLLSTLLVDHFRSSKNRFE